ncbi:Bgt-4711 [Blumeria graminis f. sp. tritici]|uniref:Bgt-4711 n=2 Tax=Blumeria graminis f. sp. tritici TaxID=62690 RepID=A0A061HES3_BLUGR|nr:hypothetical protein BGT96224_4711 [Blumeria graminis f. sp. tritici 96224]VDB94767.1 Bgt-4711 [Blumeria graminis f. sp. tritici]
MTSRFHASGSSPKSEDPNDAWQLAQQAIDATAANARAPLTKSSVQPSLYETLEANKVAKQEAFEEAHRLKHQFRALDADEADYLESMRTKAREAELRRQTETSELLQKYRQQRTAADELATVSHGSVNTSSTANIGMKAVNTDPWLPGLKKRKRPKPHPSQALKLLKVHQPSAQKGEDNVTRESASSENFQSSSQISHEVEEQSVKTNLVSYSSEDEK